jgi:putative transposase
MEELWPEADRQRCTVHRLRNLVAKLPKNDTQLRARIEAACWAALDEATSPADGEAGLRRLVTDLERECPSAAACLAEDLPALCAHLAYPLRLPKRLRSTNLLERSLEELQRRTKVIGRFLGETSCLSPCWAVRTCSSPALAGSVSPRWSTISWRRCTPPAWPRRRRR